MGYRRILATARSVWAKPRTEVFRMLLLIRTITLLAFALHAVLGCFVLHGHCAHRSSHLVVEQRDSEACEGEHSHSLHQACHSNTESSYCHQDQGACPSELGTDIDKPVEEGLDKHPCQEQDHEGTCVYLEGQSSGLASSTKSMFGNPSFLGANGTLFFRSLPCAFSVPLAAWISPLSELQRAYLQVWRI